ncbi:sensor histidine kinase [Geomesophilobacter sediminis]|uniref:histidine kinase n=1 Tax=Geomesophilobacter sediminis TaxID=2798584 RepID=A0A8J7LTF7_9BACT|nr:sensor histidine kinase [Geomesophilobacter sediminis]MBJ6723359.1 hypothetical protein [Geomesophilobacter sediminis]
MFTRGLPSIRSQLIWLVAACVLPVWLVSLYLVHFAYVEKRERVEDDILADARATSVIIDRELSSVQGALAALATSPALDQGDFKAFHRQSRALLKVFPEADIVLADASGQQLVNSFRPWGTPLPKRNNLEAVGAVFAGAKPVIGDLFFGALTGRPLVSVDVPVIRGGVVRYDLSMTLTAHRFLTLLPSRNVPRGGYVSVLDSRDITVARTLDPERSVGKSALPPLKRAIASKSSGITERTNYEGKVVLSTFCRSSLCGWTVIVGVPKSEVMSVVYRWMAVAFLGATTLSLLGLALALDIGRRIVQSIQSLVEPAVTIGRGETVLAITSQTVRETAEVSEALLEASKLIQNHIATEREQQRSLQQANELLERRVLERTADLEAALLEHEAFSYSVSHDLRAPLRHMNGYCALLLEEFADLLPEEGHHYLNRIAAASNRLGLLIDNLLELSRINRTELLPIRVDLSAEAAAIVDMFRETEPDRVVEVEIAPGLAAWGDASLLKQLLQNLLGNAWKYTARRDVARIEFGSRFEAGSTVYFIKDNGTGFEMAYADRLFKAFERLHGTDFEGVGIGLATAQRVVQRHGGKIWAYGKEGEGATFYFTLPFTLPDAPL